MFASMWMTKDVLTVTPNVPVTTIAKMMADRKIRRLPVVDAAGALVGLVSSQDVLHAFPIDVNPFSFVSGKGPGEAALKLTALDVMVTNPMRIEPETPIEEAARLMRDHKIGAMLVMRKEQLLGVLTESDVFRAFVSIFDPGKLGDQHGVRISFDNSSGQDVFPLIAEMTHQHRLRVLNFVSLHQHERPLCVVQVSGAPSGIEAMLNDIWKSRHQIISVLHLNASDNKPE